MPEKIKDLTPKEELKASQQDESFNDVADTPEIKDIRIMRERSFFGERIVTMDIPGTGAATGQNWDCARFIADMNYELLEAQFVYREESTSSGATIILVVVNDATAISAGSNFLNAGITFDDTGLRNDVQTGVLKPDRRDRLIKKGQMVGMYFTAGVVSAVGVHCTLRLRAIK